MSQPTSLSTMIWVHFSIYSLIVNILKLFYKNFLLSFFLVCFDLSLSHYFLIFLHVFNTTTFPFSLCMSICPFSFFYLLQFLFLLFPCSSPPSVNRTCRFLVLRTTAERWTSSSISPAPTHMPSPCPSCRPTSSLLTIYAASSQSRGWQRVASRPGVWKCRGLQVSKWKAF